MPSNKELQAQLADAQAEIERLRGGGVESYQSIAGKGVKEWPFEVEYFRPVKGKAGGESLGIQTINAVDEGEACRLYHLYEMKDGKLIPRPSPLRLTNCRPQVRCLDPERERLRREKYERNNQRLRELNREPYPVPRGDEADPIPRETQLEEVA